jgi:hypothetical protein
MMEGDSGKLRVLTPISRIADSLVSLGEPRPDCDDSMASAILPRDFNSLSLLAPTLAAYRNW